MAEETTSFWMLCRINRYIWRLLNHRRTCPAMQNLFRRWYRRHPGIHPDTSLCVSVGQLL
ncbi:MAG: hypothetical protein SAK29_18230 [Scytonema sp. PMC 1069.18]|nr:hypothetical protein [Scytonema sp. PMC 1069.18]MEC4882738.1 hypothetical protein [Scytonema sp. PMC 1070.18]